ncbi:MAG: hypothetical protein UU48_C0006G0118 [Candidatus Uhrbacteria bacterium GW2011_GWF2_41_16]|uniref:Sulfate transport protein CysZ n=2 Tax=Candidatus Uhriibacteriota TaxID=1752732 RepID=A0A0G0VAS3_9BACT|nr:MAG: hypothetical protein UU35_C0007G0014 [Candidatus Uhrbacteria bacterium GW2011_GWC2_41_11]KKR98078.1 MAG: hypothetical protein UU48_C0006G0118 [Candidatus Uhrbacteria bacterium GW2011_GWF2_41_16]HBO99656.1 hypothetical protein [Candidatus Uhrbacteria bacterium]
MRFAWRHDIREFFVGWHCFFRGGLLLAHRPAWWRALIIPILLHVVLFTIFVIVVVALFDHFFLFSFPRTWWALLAGLVILVSMIFFVVMLSVPILVVFGTVIVSPFYEVLGRVVSQAYGEALPQVLWREEWKQSIRQIFWMFGWYLGMQGSLFLLFLLPVVGGPFSTVFFGFLLTAGFFGTQYLGFSPQFRCWESTRQRAWCLEHKGLICGFGMAVGFCLLIPGMNFFVPSAAVVAGVLLVREHGGDRAHFQIVRS